jgi:hypothetical protein
MRRCRGEKAGVAAGWGEASITFDWVSPATTRDPLFPVPNPNSRRSTELPLHRQAPISSLQIVPGDQNETSDKPEMLKEGFSVAYRLGSGVSQKRSATNVANKVKPLRYKRTRPAEEAA